MRKTIRGFTIIELLVVVAVMGILATIGLVSFARVQSDARDSQRSSRITTIAESLEKYYDKYGTYPSCAAMAATPSTVTTTTLKNLDPSVLTAPKATSGTNSILAACAELSTTDAYAYKGGGCTADGCLQYTLKYLEESTGNPISLLSRHRLPAPNLPTNLVAVTTSSASIDVSWSPVSGADSYTLQRDTNSSFTGPTITDPASTPFTSSSLSQGIKYYYRVNATNENGASGWSTTANATTTIDAPAAPVVTANTVPPTTTWSWPAVSCAAGTTARYQYKYTVTPPGTDPGWTAIAGSPVAFTTIVIGELYTVAVQAQCYTIETTSAWGVSGSASYTPIAPPTNLVATTASSTLINVSWNAVSGAISYTLHRDTNSSFPSPTIVTQAGITYPSSGLSQGIKYYYRVLASDAGGPSDWSTTANATTTVDAPAAPVVTANTVTPTTTWSWPAVTCPAGTTVRYQYRYTVTPLGSDTGWVAIASSPVAFTTNTAGQTYTVQVQAQCYTTETTSAWSAAGSDSYTPVTYTLAISAGAGGTVNTAVNGTYISGDTPTITATPNANYAFSSWTGGGNCAGIASHTILMNANQTCVANFVATYTLAISAGANGTVNTAVNGTYNSGDTPTITATPNANYAFSSWTGGGNCAGIASHTILMNANQTCTANFVTALAFRATGVYNSSGSTTAVVVKPAGTIDGDLMFVVLERAGAVNPSGVPAGWTIIRSNLATYGYWLYYRVASGEGASWTWTWAASVRTMGRAHSFYGGFNTGTPIQSSTVPYSNTASATAVDIPTLTTSSNNTISLIFASGFSSASKTFAVPANWTERNDTGSTSPDFWQAIASRVFPTSGTATGVVSYPISAVSTYRVGVQVMVNMQ